MDPMSKVNRVFNNRNLASTSQKATKTITNYVSSGVSLTLNNNSKEGFSYLVLGILLGDLWLLKGVLSAQKRNFYFNYRCIFLHRLMCIIGFCR